MIATQTLVNEVRTQLEILLIINTRAYEIHLPITENEYTYCKQALKAVDIIH